MLDKYQLFISYVIQHEYLDMDWLKGYITRYAQGKVDWEELAFYLYEIYVTYLIFSCINNKITINDIAYIELHPDEMMKYIEQFAKSFQVVPNVVPFEEFIKEHQAKTIHPVLEGLTRKRVSPSKITNLKGWENIIYEILCSHEGKLTPIGIVKQALEKDYSKSKPSIEEAFTPAIQNLIKEGKINRIHQGLKALNCPIIKKKVPISKPLSPVKKSPLAKSTSQTDIKKKKSPPKKVKSQPVKKSPEYKKAELKLLTVADLKKIAKQYAMTNLSKLRKDELINKLYARMLED